MPALSEVSEKTHRALARAFYGLGKAIGRRPRITILLTTVFAFACSAGFADFKEENNAEKLYTPQSAVAFTHRKYVEDAFGQQNSRCQVFAEAHESAGSAGAMAKDALLELFDAHQAIVTAETKVDGETVTFAGKETGRCARDGTGCTPIEGALSPWSNNRTKLEADSDPIATAVTFFKTSERHTLDMAFGGIKRDASGKVTGARASTIIFEVIREEEKVDGEPDTDKRSDAIQLDIDNKVLALKTVYTRLLPFTNAGRDEKAGDALAKDSSTLLSASYLVCIVFSAYVLLQNNRVHSHMHLSVWSVVSVGLSIMVSFGLCNAFGVKFNNVVATLAFLLLGLGLDDTYVIMNNASRVNNDPESAHLPSDERMARALSRAGSAITVTSVTDFCAFAVGAATVLPALRDFCIYASVGIACDFFFQVTFFYAIVVLDARREEAKKMDCCCCFTVAEEKQTATFCGSTPNTYNPKDPGMFTRIMGTHYPRLLSNPAAKGAVLAAGVGLTVAGIIGATQLETDFNIDWFIPEGNYVKDAQNLRDEYWSGDNLPYAAFTREGDYFAARNELTALCKAVRDNKWTLADSTRCWYDDYAAWEPNGGCAAVADSVTFSNCVRAFVDSPAGMRYNSSIAFENYECGTGGKAGCVIKASRVDALMVTLKNSREQIEGMDDTRKVVSEAAPSLKAFAYSFVFIFIEGYKVIAWETLRNVILAAVCVFVICVVLLANVQAALLILLMVACIDVCILGIGLNFVGYTFNSVTCILVVISVGLAVDYSAHVSHAFLSADGKDPLDPDAAPTNDSRMRQALAHMAVPVFNGGLSTWLACSGLIFATSYVFTAYFIILTIIVAVSLFFGLCVLPVLLTVVGPSGVGVAEGADVLFADPASLKARAAAPAEAAL